MSSYVSDEYLESKRWIAKQIQDGKTWDDVANLCVSEEKVDETFFEMKMLDMIIPEKMSLESWKELVEEQRKSHFQIVDMYGLSEGKNNGLTVPAGAGSSWNEYKNMLLGTEGREAKMSDAAVENVENYCHWILNHLDRNTREKGPIKGLVMGSVQSGKTANMIGLVSMAADYDWNIFIILSGTIDSLRKQTRDRFFNDLQKSQGVNWRLLDYSNNPDYMIDMKSGEKLMADNLELNTLENKRMGYRYVTVCLKNPKRLERLINWLHSSPARAARMRIVIIDDEADQASINTAKMSEFITDEDIIERTAINQLIINLANGKEADGSETHAPFQAVNYISFTATPYANVLNEAYESSLYPKDFVCSLPESKEYFGAKVIFGSINDEKYPGLDIIRTIPKSEMTELKMLHGGGMVSPPEEMKKSIYWFLCAAGVLRKKGHKKPISMLIHTASIQANHFEEYEVLKTWLAREREAILCGCEQIYEKEKERLTAEKLKEAYPDYGCLDDVDKDMPLFSEIKDEIIRILSHIENIQMGEDKKTDYYEDAVHLCVDNCSANRRAEEGTFLRIIYPNRDQLNAMNKAPVFIVMGGNTLSRGLTIEGLVCTYFARNSNLADTLMQMARWFGYRRGYELLQRIWMNEQAQEKFVLLEEIDEKLKEEFEEFAEKGKSPALFGPRIVNSAKIARFLITAKNKSQNAELCEYDFSGDTYETTKFEKSEELQANIAVAEEFLNNLNSIPEQSSTIKSATVWRNVSYQDILNKFLDKYTIFDCSSLSKDIINFKTWMEKQNAEQKLLWWNVAVAGDVSSDDCWTLKDCSVGKIERSKKRDKPYIDIGSLRSGRDILCDVDYPNLSAKEVERFEKARKSGKHLVSARSELGLKDTPLLLLYCIAGNKGKESGLRTAIGSTTDIIGFSIVISGEIVSTDHASMIRVKIPMEDVENA